MPEVVLITGASSGLGKATAERLSASGFTVYGASRAPQTLPASWISVQMDVTDERSVKTAIDHIIKREGRIDVLVNNAGSGIGGAIENFSDAEARQQFEANFFGMANVTRAVLPHMREQNGGKIIQISSIGGLMGLPFQGYYSASKFAVEGFSEALSLEVKPYNIRIVVVNPGDFKTGFTHNRKFTALDSMGSVYENPFRKACSVMERDEQTGCDPARLAKVVEKIVRSKRPGYRFRIGRWDQRLMARIKPVLPHFLAGEILRGHYRMK